MNYHAHIYYSEKTREIAQSMRQKISSNLAIDSISPLIDKLVGPHTASMFEVDFSESNLEIVIQWLEKHRKGLSVLIHPVIEDEYEAHLKKGKWLGTILPLNSDGF
jgi:aromatic ring-cleaving dioxygenase